MDIDVVTSDILHYAMETSAMSVLLLLLLFWEKNQNVIEFNFAHFVEANSS